MLTADAEIASRPVPGSSGDRGAVLAVARQKKGLPGELRDTMIAGIVLANHATLATRNVHHFDDIAKRVVNPWEAKA